ncbi:MULTISPECIES: TAXI family TRAP transporter solute-binding subunit [Modicisalibacter]|uniref:TAXI family TRAP transporter solute-binding subunit n=1 Tax=Modicisalibacter TaxID=574347 RepID=UPI00100A5028|nr:MULTISPECIES: TAXI family TRAP transporter solute-binding subunit [Halomonadaceae]MBZ9559183.1 TAXI family TRAP transporter solute-binding subunit [Modicisalibacter sp. R2A 31.J]MBZ9576652.1 TAXI family TRAP transporter solute-binding subunit [Modicisalibacter sp. MOD 31.J]
MHKRQFLKSAIGLATAAALGVSASSALAQDGSHHYIMGTATTGGTYYPVGVALSTLVKVKLEPKTGISVSAISSAGSGENLKLMDADEAQFGILQGLYGAYAWKGTGPVPKAYKNLRSVSMLWQNVEHFVVKDAIVDSGTIDDMTNLYGKAFSIGARNSGTEGSGRYILGQLGIEPDKMDIAYLGYGPSADALQNGTIQGMNIPAGVPASAVTRAYANVGGDITTLDFNAEQLAKVNSEFELWTPYDIPAGTYPNQDEVIHTIAQPNILAVRADVPADDVYAITKTMYENLPFLQNIHPATKAMAIEKAIAGLPMPLHPGAARYFEEQGIEIPDRLMPKADGAE